MLPSLDGSRHREDAISEFQREIMLMTDDWKLVVNGSGEPYLLFDRTADPEERHNLATEPEADGVRRELKLRMFERLIQSQVAIPWS